MLFEKIERTQPKVVKMLVNSYKKNRLAHAYIFDGEKGTKKLETAFNFAKMLFCSKEDKPCGKCNNCKRIDTLNHPNLYLIEPKGVMIRKEQITNLIEEFSKTSLEDGPKVYIINHIDKMNVQAANSLLKFLEEPLNESYAILITENINKVLSTIISRSQVITFSPIDKQSLKEELGEMGFDRKITESLPEYTNNLDEALQFASDEKVLRIIDLVTELMNVRCSSKESLVMYFNENSDILYSEKRYSDLFLSLIIVYQKDILNYKIGNIDNIVFNDEIECIEKLAKKEKQNRILSELEMMLSLKIKIHMFINERLAYDNLFLKLERRY